ncbi:MAG TPA: enoyl-CoA hydratase-related protein [Chloroflexota bacterium]|nr:enoyl-CoA hydratase-related protein [Chloroflexota bacterium]
MTAETEYETLLIDRDGAVEIVTINRPKVLNALSQTVLRELEQVVDAAGADDSTRVLIITGSGDRAFAAGADIAELQALESALDGHRHSHDAHHLLLKMADLPKPVIMAVNGYALGGGCELAMAGDIILASEKASFGQPEINLGIIPGFGGTFRLPRLVGRTKAMEMVLVGDRISAQEAKELGLVNAVVPPDQLLDLAIEMGKKIASKSPAAVKLAKRAINEGLEIDGRSAADLEAVYFGIAIGTEDRKEGTSAFLEKREPRFTGR